jgi:serine/threonine-protein phosphatase PPG1
MYLARETRVSTPVPHTYTIVYFLWMAPFDLDACIAKLSAKQLLGEALLREICEKTKEVLMRESNVVHVSSPVTVVGDIHGQFHDLIEIFRIGGSAPSTNYLFLGKWSMGL